MHKRKILCVHPSVELYGSDRVFIEVMSAIKEDNPDIRLDVILPNAGKLSEEISFIADSVLTEKFFVLRRADVLWLPVSLFKLIYRLVVAVRRINQYDFVYISTTVCLDYILATRFSRRKSAIHVHEIPTGIAKYIFSFILFFSKSFLIFISGAAKEGYSFLSRKKCKVVWNGVKEVASQGMPPLAQEKRQQVKVLLIGRFNSWKGHSLLVNSVANICADSDLDIIVRFVGGVYSDQHHFKNNVVDLVINKNLSEIIEILDFTDDPTDHYNWADIVVVPSIKPEPFGLVAIEAMSAGRPVVAADHGGLSEIIVHGDTGLKFTPGSVESLTECLISYIRSPRLRIQHGRNARKRYIENFRNHTFRSAIVKALIAAGF